MSAVVRTTPWLDHLVRAGSRYHSRRGDYYAAAITYFTMLSLFPLLMVAYWVAGILLSRHPEWLGSAHREIVAHIPGQLGHEVGELLDRAVDARTTVGVVGLVGGAYSGLNWIANMRAALTEQWEQHHDPPSWWRSKLSDLAKLVGLLLVGAASLGLSALSSTRLGLWVLHRCHLADTGAAPVLLALGGIALSLLSSWAMFTYLIARLPHEPLRARSAVRAGVLAAVVFEGFKQFAGWYLTLILRSPAGAVFGPIIGLMVFAYFTCRIILFATAWAATAADGDTQPKTTRSPSRG